MFTQKYTTNKIYLLAAVLIFSPLVVKSAHIEASVSVSPVGDFVAEFKDVDAYAYAEGNTYKAERIIIPWSKISTGMSLRDKHAKDYFHADKYPNIEVATALGRDGKGVAKVKMNGVEKVVKGTYTRDGDNIIAEFPVILSQFNVTNVNFKGAGVQDEVKVKVTVPVRAQAK